MTRRAIRSRRWPGLTHALSLPIVAIKMLWISLRSMGGARHFRNGRNPLFYEKFKTVVYVQTDRVYSANIDEADQKKDRLLVPEERDSDGRIWKISEDEFLFSTQGSRSSGKYGVYELGSNTVSYVNLGAGCFPRLRVLKTGKIMCRDLKNNNFYLISKDGSGKEVLSMEEGISPVLELPKSGAMVVVKPRFRLLGKGAGEHADLNLLDLKTMKTTPLADDISPAGGWAIEVIQ